MGTNYAEIFTNIAIVVGVISAGLFVCWLISLD